MKQNYALTLSLMGGLLLLATACVKEKTDDEKLRPVGSEIIFAAATSYENDDRTRTVYTGKDENGQDVTTSSTIERIDWENDDRVSIVYVPGSPSQAEYKVTNVLTSNNENDLADVVPSGSSKLTWAAAGSTDIFYAMYPTANGKHPNNDAHLVFSNNTANVQGVIPSSQPVDLSRTQSVPVPGNPNQTYNRYLPDMQYAYMVGYADDSCRDGSRVTIPFTPAVTAFNFIFKAASAVTVTGFEMSTAGAGNVGTTLAGNFNFNITGAKRRPDTQSGTVVGAAWNSNNVNRTGPSGDNGKTITVSFSQDITLSANQYLDFTVFTLPIDQKGLSITFTCKSTNNNGAYTYTKTLDLKDSASSWHTFAAGKKHVVTNDKLAGESVTYTFDVTSSSYTASSPVAAAGSGSSKGTYKVTSYRKVGNNSPTPVPWEVSRYRVSNGNGTWGTWQTTKPDMLSTFTTSGTPSSTSAQSYDVKIAASSALTSTNALKNSAYKGSSSAPYDLSTHNYVGETISKTTANCYIITSPGYYKLPLAYGNAYKGGATNTDAYAPTKSTEARYLTPFKKHSGTISSPNISGSNTAELVWQDAKNLITPSTITISSGFIVFEITKDNIKEGNAVIAVKNSDGTVLWSWHIWVTPYVNNLPAKMPNGNNDVSLRGKTFMMLNLGWCDDSNASIQMARRVEVEFHQLGGSDLAKKTLVFYQQEKITQGNSGSGPQYQWGRKDPILPCKITTTAGDTGNKTWYNAGGTSSTTLSGVKGPKNPQYGIQHPEQMIWLDRDNLPAYSASWKYVDWIGSTDTYYGTGHYCNLWNYNATTDDQVTAMLTVYTFRNLKHGKTVYDPCPTGYTVPLPTEVAALATDTQTAMGGTNYTGSGTITWNGTKRGWITSDNLIPASGFRLYLKDKWNYVDGYRNQGSLQSSAYGNAHVPLNLYFNTTALQMTVNYSKALAQSVRCVPE